MKQIMFLAVLQAIRLRDNEWARLYERLVKAKCPYDERTQSHTGKTRVIGRVAGEMTRPFTLCSNEMLSCSRKFHLARSLHRLCCMIQRCIDTIARDITGP